MKRTGPAAALAAAVVLAVAIGAMGALAGLTGCAVRVPRSVGVTVDGPAGRLAGSLFLPEGRGPHPAVVLVQTSRENSRLDYLREARFLASRGVAAFAYDKRGTGSSDGDLGMTNFEFLARDAMAAARALRRRPDIDSTRVGYWGMDQGGWIAPIAASYDTTAAFLILVSAPVVSPLEQTMVQRRQELEARGTKPETSEAIARLRRRIWEYWLAPAGSGSAASDSLRAAFHRARRQPWFAGAVVSHDLPESLTVDEAMNSDGHPARRWLDEDMPTFWSLRYDPVPTLERVRAPILAVYGQKDRVIPVVESTVNFEAALGRAYNRRGIVRIFRGADHRLLVRAGSGLFARVEPAPGYADTVSAWLARVARVGKGPLRPPFRP